MMIFVQLFLFRLLIHKVHADLQRHYESLQISFEVSACVLLIDWLVAIDRLVVANSQCCHILAFLHEKKKCKDRQKRKEDIDRLQCAANFLVHLTFQNCTDASLLCLSAILVALSLSLSPQRILCARTWVCLHAQAADGSKVELFWLVSERACSSQGPLAEERAHTLTLPAPVLHYFIFLSSLGNSRTNSSNCKSE